MATKKKKRPLLTDSKDWYKEQVEEFKLYITNIKLNNINDRIAAKPTKNGGVVSQVITIEEQATHKMKMLNDLPKLITELAELEAIEANEEDTTILTRGDIEIPDIMRKNE
jgi:hypothetical protein